MIKGLLLLFVGVALCSGYTGSKTFNLSFNGTCDKTICAMHATSAQVATFVGPKLGIVTNEQPLAGIGVSATLILTPTMIAGGNSFTEVGNFTLGGGNYFTFKGAGYLIPSMNLANANYNIETGAGVFQGVQGIVSANVQIVGQTIHYAMSTRFA